MTAPLFVEIRCEELPARFVTLAADQLAERVTALLQGVGYGTVRTWATPRRVAVEVADVAAGRPVEVQLVTGPPAKAAFRDGKPTGAAQGFARGKGVAVEDLEIVETSRGEVVAARVETGGEQTVALVAAGLEEAVLGIRFPMRMRWGTGSTRWARPLHGVVALYGGQVVPASIAGITAGAETLGHRHSPGPITVTSAAQWVEALRVHHVEPDREARRRSILSQLEALAAEAAVEVRPDPDLVEEVVDLVEWPAGVLCAFDEDLLALPPRLLEESMRVHQKVFPLWRGPEQLDHRFIAISNHTRTAAPETTQTIAAGNAKVIGARFHDAKFFYAEDRRKRLEDHDRALERMQWIRHGGTVQEKARRVGALAGAISDSLGADSAVAFRAGRLSKADLATQMVGEFPKLQGHVGRLLAGFDGEPEDVPLAIEEHYLPRYNGDALPTTPAGRATAMADRLDTLAGCFAVGIRLKGSSDPLGLRRAAHGLLSLLLDSGLRAELPQLFSTATGNLGEEIERRAPKKGGSDDPVAELVDFTMARFRALLREDFDTEVVDAVLDAGGDRDPVALHSRVAALAALADSPEFGPLKATFKRASGLVKEHLDDATEPDRYEADAERALYAALDDVGPRARAAAGDLDHAAALAALSELKAPVDRLFDEVMVMAEDPAVRANRLGLLRRVVDEFGQVADFGRLSLD